VKSNFLPLHPLQRGTVKGEKRRKKKFRRLEV